MGHIDDMLSDFVTGVSDFVPSVPMSDFVAKPFIFVPNNSTISTVTMKHLLWIHLLPCFGYLFPEITNGLRFYRTPTKDVRFRIASISTHGGFPITKEESIIIARMVKNYVDTQKYLQLETHDTDYIWPQRVTEEYITTYQLFSIFSQQSGGFTIE